MRVAASDISTQDTSTDIAMEVTHYMTMKCAMQMMVVLKKKEKCTYAKMTNK